MLERHHGFIQWIFPIRERGMNSLAPQLQLHEISKMKENEECMKRYVKAYDTMLKFYGIERLDNDGESYQRNITQFVTIFLN